MKDIIVEEIRNIRDAHAGKFNYDLDAICEDFKAHQIDCGHPTVRLEPKKIADRTFKRTAAYSRFDLSINPPAA